MKELLVKKKKILGFVVRFLFKSTLGNYFPPQSYLKTSSDFVTPFDSVSFFFFILYIIIVTSSALD